MIRVQLYESSDSDRVVQYRLDTLEDARAWIETVLDRHMACEGFKVWDTEQGRTYRPTVRVELRKQPRVEPTGKPSPAPGRKIECPEELKSGVEEVISIIKG